MTTAIPSQSLTASDFLFGGTQDSIDGLAQALDQKGILGTLDAGLAHAPRAGRSATDREIATVAQGLLDLDLGDLVVAGWRKHTALTAAAERTIATPGSSEVVEVATHRISCVQRPSVELFINDLHVAEVRFELDIEVVVKGLVGTVRQGQLVALHSGTCDITGTLAAEGVPLVTQQGRIDLPLLIRLPLRIHPNNGEPVPPSGGGPLPSSA